VTKVAAPQSLNTQVEAARLECLPAAIQGRSRAIQSCSQPSLQGESLKQFGVVAVKKFQNLVDSHSLIDAVGLITGFGIDIESSMVKSY